MKTKRIILAATTLILAMQGWAQQFFNLTYEDVKIDSVIPAFTHSFELGDAYADSTYSVSIEYPEFIDMNASDTERYMKIAGTTPPSMPDVRTAVAVERKKGSLLVGFNPIVCREGKMQKLVSFMLSVKSEPISMPVRTRLSAASADTDEYGYARHSVLSKGKWAKIRVPHTGVYQLTGDLIRKAGFSDLSKVRIFGYGGALQKERLAKADLIATDDLMEVGTCNVGGKRLFFAQGPVSWSSNTATDRTRNPYSDYGYYFLTQDDETPLSISEEVFSKQIYPTAADYHILHEVDNFAWYEGGRNLCENSPIPVGSSKDYKFTIPEGNTTAYMTIVITSNVVSSASISVNGKVVKASQNITIPDYYKGNESKLTVRLTDLTPETTVSIKTLSGGPVRLDYIQFTIAEPAAAPNLSSSSIPVPEYVYNITNQDLHSDPQADMVIIIPASAKLLAQAQRLADFHKEHDGMTVRIIPADELYNEFSSGTPDANAYRRYMKMLYDRAGTDEKKLPRYLLLFGDGFWDNRLNVSALSNLDSNDYLLCYESENSFSETECYVNDGFYCLLDEGEGANQTTSDKMDIAVGRFPVTSVSEAKAMVDKTIAYMSDKEFGSWTNTVVFLGDDGNNNLHMQDAEACSKELNLLNDGTLVKKIMWDVYDCEKTSTGNIYPEVTSLIKQNMMNGALMFNYSGHGGPSQISHEAVIKTKDMMTFKNTHLPLWITASCDIMPFDSSSGSLGEETVLNPDGGAVAFYGTTRTVYSTQNRKINLNYIDALYTRQPDGNFTSLGEAQRLAKNALIDGSWLREPDKDDSGKPLSGRSDRGTNKLQYTLLGDPALVLHIPTLKVVVDKINGKPIEEGGINLQAGSRATISGHIESNGKVCEDFNGGAVFTVRDSKELLQGRMNDQSADGTNVPFYFYDRTKTLFNGENKVKDGRFETEFPVPMDINYSGESGLINIYAYSADGRHANGSTDNFTIGGSNEIENDGKGPSVFCYLRDDNFRDGDTMGASPYFYAQISDNDGLNTSGVGIGHNLEVCVDGRMDLTFNLNDNFQFTFGSFTTGTTWYVLPRLSDGEHTLRFRAWDILNNPTVKTLRFRTSSELDPDCLSITCTDNPAKDSTTFVIAHNQPGSELAMTIELFDMSGRMLWSHTETSVSGLGTHTYKWDLTTSGGSKLQTGVYLYRVRLNSPTGKGELTSSNSKARKLIVVSR